MVTLTAESEKEMADLNTQIAQMKKELAERSPLCNFLKKGPSPARYGHFFTEINLQNKFTQPSSYL